MQALSLYGGFMGIQQLVYRKSIQRIDASSTGINAFVTAHRPLKAALEALPTQGSGAPHLLVAGTAGSGRTTFARAAWRKIRQPLRPFIYVSCSSLRRYQDIYRLLQQARGGDLVLTDIEFFPAFFLSTWLEAVDRLGSVRVIGLYECRDQKSADAFFSRWDMIFERRVYLPPLRERAEDIPLLVAQTLHLYPSISLAPAALRSLETASWPGEIAQLICHVKNLAQQGLKQQQFVIAEAQIETRPAYGRAELAFFSVCEWVREEGLLAMARRWGMKYTGQMVDAAILALTLEECVGCTRQAAHLLQMPVTTLAHRKKVLQQMVHLLDFAPAPAVQ